MSTTHQIAFAESIISDKAPMDPNVVSFLGDLDDFPPLMQSSKPGFGSDGWQVIYPFEAGNRTSLPKVTYGPQNTADLDDNDSLLTWEYIDDNGDSADPAPSVKQAPQPPSAKPVQRPAHNSKPVAESKRVASKSCTEPEDESSNGGYDSDTPDSYDSYVQEKYISTKHRVRENVVLARNRKEAIRIIAHATERSPNDLDDVVRKSGNQRKKIPDSTLRKSVTAIRKDRNVSRLKSHKNYGTDVSVDICLVERR